MARSKVVVETVYCDLCGRPVGKPLSQSVGLGRDSWELDLCAADMKRLQDQFGKWTKEARPIRRRQRRTEQQARDEWDYLEKLGFRRHRGRKSASEIAALAKRKR
ncbi:MAG: hypothetical protein QOK28_3892 [Actinomycetota bacterium]|jgi:hypothetical protein